MYDQAMVWNTDRNLQVTSLTARLRGLAEIGNHSALHVSDLWGKDEPFNVAVVAHQWALDGEHLRFEAAVSGRTLSFELQPLHDLSGATVGVSGRAVELPAGRGLHSDAFRHAERFAGMGTWYEDLRTGLATISEGLGVLLGIDHHTHTFDVRAYDYSEEREHIARSIAVQEPDSYVCDHRVHCAGGRIRSVRERLRTIHDERGLAIARVGTLIDISDLKEREAELSELALQDALTRLPNRAALEERLAEAVLRCERSDRRCAVLFADLDDFKAINDMHGHDFGDRVLASVADRLTRQIRGTDTVARLGGDEFVIVIDELFSDEAALDAARKILRSLDEPFIVDDRCIAVSASIGIATYPGSGTTPQQLLSAADREMYVVKRNGGRGVKLAAMEKETPPHNDEKAMCQVHYLRDHRHFGILANASRLS